MAESSATPGSAWNARNPAVKRILQVSSRPNFSLFFLPCRPFRFC
jgi:hypothetical protein